MSIGEANRFFSAYLESYEDVREIYYGMRVRAKAGIPLRTWGGRVYYPEHGLPHKFLNYLIQPSSSDITKEAMIRAHQLGLELVLSVHDELLIVCDQADSVASAAKLREAMESVELSLKFPIDAFGPAESWGMLTDLADRK